MNPQLPYWLATQYMPVLSARRIISAAQQFSDLKTLFESNRDELLAKGLLEKDIPFITHPNWQSVEKDLAWSQLSNHHLMTMNAEDYPRLLKEISHPPHVLYIKGNKSILQSTQIAIVGTRRPTALGTMHAKHFASVLADMRLTITSGLALGIDGAAHRGALSNNGLTIAVLGSGINHIYPLSHQDLVYEILNREGAIISEFPLATPPHRYNFPRRNRIISGLSIGTLVIEAALQSGSLITAHYALQEGREVFAIPGSIQNPQAKGCHYLIRQGAKLVEKVEDILEELTIWHDVSDPAISSSTSPQANEVLDAPLQKLLAEIGHEITPIDVITWRSGLTASNLSSMLLILELKGYIQSNPGGYVRTLKK